MKTNSKVRRKDTRPAARIYDEAAYRWQNVNDVPYKLDSIDLTTMQNMERALDFILENLEDLSMDVEQCSEAAGYTTEYFKRAFKEYYGLPFGKFVTKLRLRQAAREIMSGVYANAVGKSYGFATIQSFSKAFRNEFGVSPREFRTHRYEVPDMPIRHTVKGIPITLEYRSVNAFRMEGHMVPPPQGQDTFLMDQTSFIFGEEFTAGKELGLNLDSPEEQVGIWWHEPDYGLEYAFGPIIDHGDTMYLPAIGEKNMHKLPYTGDDPDDLSHWVAKTLTIQGGNYAVFSFPRPENSKDIFIMSRILARFTSREWIPMNHKIRNTLGCTYFTYDSKRVCEYVPLSQGMSTDGALHTTQWSIQSWADYIDQNITDNLTLRSLAIAANYSVNNYRDIFSMYYGMTPTEYIIKRRLVLASEELSSGIKESVVLKKYHYVSRKQLEHEYETVFGHEQCKAVIEEPMLTDLISYYATNKERIKISFRNEMPRIVLMYSIEESEDTAIPDDLIGRITYWFKHEFRDFATIKSLFALTEEKLFVWGNDSVYEDGQIVYKYYEGTVISPDDNKRKMEVLARTKGAILEEIPGGRYAVFSTQGKDDIVLTEEAMRLLTRCAFGGYINENRWRIDMKRRTFIIWRGNKLYFYVPIVR